MKIKNIMLGLLACGAFGFVSCSDDDFTEFQSALNVTSAETTIEAAGGTKHISVEGPLASVYTSASWLSVSAEGQTVSVTACVNSDVQSRNAIVVMKASANDSTIVNISQMGARVEVSVPEQITVLAHGDADATFPILHNIPLTTTASDSWISADITDDAITIHTAANAGGGNRTGYIDIETGSASWRINVAQYDICGSYELTGTDFASRPADVKLTGKIIGGANGNEVLFSLDKYNGELQIPLTFDASTQSMSINAASYCGMNSNLWVYTVLIYGTSQGFDPEISLSGALNIGDNDEVTFGLTDGEWNDKPVIGFRLRTFTEDNPVSNKVRGTLENVKTPLFTRISAN